MTPLTALNKSNTVAEHYHTEARYFSGSPYWNVLTGSGIYSSTCNWSAPDTSKPGTWTEVTGLVYGNENLAVERSGNSITWEANISGCGYAASNFGVGRALSCWRRYWTSTCGWQSWFLDWIGEVVDGNWGEDYRHGGEWQRAVHSGDVEFGRYDSPRLVAGRLDIMDSATVTVSDTLAQASAEANNGEFVGTLASVAAANMVDGKIDTVWISDTQPSAVQQDTSAGAQGGVEVSEIFLKPVEGFSENDTWWIEFYNSRSETFLGRFLNARTEYDGVAQSVYPMNDLGCGQFGILCANRAMFDAYTGGHAKAQWIIDARTINPNFILHSGCGIVGISGDGKPAWNQTGSQLPAITQFDLDRSNTCPHFMTGSAQYPLGSSYRLTEAGVEQDNWYQEAYPSPGRNSAPSAFAWIKVNLKANDFTATGSFGTSSTCLALNTTVGLPASGSLICEADSFAYTARTQGGVTGLSDVSASHAISAIVQPYAKDMVGSACAAQTGWPIASTRIRRRKQPVPQNVRVYWSQKDASLCKNPTEGSFQSDYYAHAHMISNNTQLDILSQLVDGITSGSDWRWVRTIAITVDRMFTPSTKVTQFIPNGQLTLYVESTAGWPATGLLQAFPYEGEVAHPTPIIAYTAITATTITLATSLLHSVQIGEMVLNQNPGRAKINEITADIPQTSINYSDLGDLDTIASGELAKYILTNYFRILATDFVDESSASSHLHDIGSHSLAIVPYTRVLDDIAKKTGCVVYYGRDGRVHWQSDPWWPGFSKDPMINLSASSVRGEIKWTDNKSDIDYIVINATSVDGLRSYRSVHPPTEDGSVPVGKRPKELSDYSVPDPSFVPKLAEMEYKRAVQTAKLGITLRGLGDWPAPDQWILMNYDLVGSGSVQCSGWVTERYSRSIDINPTRPTFDTKIEAREFIKPGFSGSSFSASIAV